MDVKLIPKIYLNKRNYKMSTLFEKVVKEHDAYASKRKFAYKRHTKKITPESLAQEISIGRVLGELSGAERILRAIVENKDWTREDIEAELHLFIESLSEISSLYLKGKKVVDLNNILEIYGYFGKDMGEN